MKNITAGILVFVLSIMSLGCGAGQITSTLSVIVQSAEIALPIIAAVDPGLNQVIITDAENYLQAVNTAVVSSGPILSDVTFSAAVKAAKITVLFAGLAAANLPAGTPQLILNAINKVSNAVVSFLANFAVANVSTVGPSVKIVLTSADQKSLEASVVKAKSNLAKISSMRTTQR
jgi:hypothetical protein